MLDNLIERTTKRQQSLPLKMSGFGSYLPERIVRNHELESLCGLPEGWIEEKSGVRERRWIDGETNSFMGAAAAREAIEDAQLSWDQIDFIIYASGTSEQFIPDGSPLLQRELGLGESGIPCMTIHATCLSFLFAMETVAALLQVGRYRNIMVVTADIASVGLNFEDPQSSTLFGDAATAVIMTLPSHEEASALERVHLETYGVGADFTHIRGGGCRYHPNDPNTKPEDNLFGMDGPAVLKLTAKYGPGFLEALRPGLSQTLGDIDLVVPHQASRVGLQLLEHFGWPKEKIMSNLETRGNCIAASLPLTLIESIRDGKLARGQRCLMVGTGAGLSMGGALFTF